MRPNGVTPPPGIAAFDLNALKAPPAPPQSNWEVKLETYREGTRIQVMVAHGQGVFIDALTPDNARIIGNGMLQLANIVDPPGLYPVDTSKE